MRSAVYRAASAEERRSVHRALAAATDPDARSRSPRLAPRPGDARAGRGRRRRARALGRPRAERAAASPPRPRSSSEPPTLTPEPARRAQRALAAAQAKHEAGAPDAALELLAAAEAGPLDELQRARLERLRAQIAFALRRGSDAPPLLLRAAQRLEPLDAGLARETYLEALAAAIFAGRLGSGGGVLEVAEAARAAPPAPQPPRAIDLLLDGLATRFTDGYAAGVPAAEASAERGSGDERHSEDDIRWLWLACRIAPDLWDDETWHELPTRQVQLARDAGALTVLPLALTYRAGVHVHAGEFAAAAALIEEADAITRGDRQRAARVHRAGARRLARPAKPRRPS